MTKLKRVCVTLPDDIYKALMSDVAGKGVALSTRITQILAGQVGLVIQIQKFGRNRPLVVAPLHEYPPVFEDPLVPHEPEIPLEQHGLQGPNKI